jgi:predicted nucleic acid-binding protein
VILVDTSVLIDYIKNTANHKTGLFQQILDRRFHYGISAFSYLEVLQGARDEKEYTRLSEYLGSLTIYGPRPGLETYNRAAEMAIACRQKGVTIRSTVDTIIAAIAIEQDLSLLHNDTDFDNIQKHVAELRICNELPLN